MKDPFRKNPNCAPGFLPGTDRYGKPFFRGFTFLGGTVLLGPYAQLMGKFRFTCTMLACFGLGNAEIGDRLSVSGGTVSGELSGAFGQLGLPKTNYTRSALAAASLAGRYLIIDELGLPGQYPVDEDDLKIIRLIAGGYNNASIAQKLETTTGTIHNSIDDISFKAGFSGRELHALGAMVTGQLDPAAIEFAGRH